MNEREARFFLSVVKNKKLVYISCKNETDLKEIFVFLKTVYNHAAGDWWFIDMDGFSYPPFKGLTKKSKPWHYKLVNEEDYPKYWDIFWD